MLQGNKILLTGLTGRIGGAAAVALAPSNEVWGLARYTKEGTREAAEKLGVIPVVGDFARGSLDAVPRDFDYIVHIAANVSPRSAEEGMLDNSDGAARLMSHCHTAKAFLHVSASSVYAQTYPEDSDLGGSYGGQYSPTKVAAEGAVRAAALILNLPTAICRQNVQYGGLTGEPGLIDRFLDVFVETGEVYLPPTGPMVIGPIHEDDIVDLIEPSLKAASVPAFIVNWGGDERVDWQELFEYVGFLIDKTPKFIRKPEFAFPNYFPDPTKRRAMAGPCKIDWKTGIRRTLQLRFPDMALKHVD
jgi:nucleoside-diphosphate-sugar epimerase